MLLVNLYAYILYFRPINDISTHLHSETTHHNNYENGHHNINQLNAKKHTVIKNGGLDQNGYRRGMSSGSSSSPLSTASSSGSTVISR